MRKSYVAALLVVAAIVILLVSLYPKYSSQPQEIFLTFDRVRILPVGIEFRFEENVVLKFVGKKASVVRLPKLVPAEYTVQLSENTHWYGGENDRFLSVRFYLAHRSLSPYSRIFLASKEDPYGRKLPFTAHQSFSFIWRVEDEGQGKRYENGYPHPVIRFAILPNVEIPFLRHDCGGWKACIHVGGHDFSFHLDFQIRIIEFKS